MNARAVSVLVAALAMGASVCATSLGATYPRLLSPGEVARIAETLELGWHCDVQERYQVGAAAPRGEELDGFQFIVETFGANVTRAALVHNGTALCRSDSLRDLQYYELGKHGRAALMSVTDKTSIDLRLWDATGAEPYRCTWRNQAALVWGAETKFKNEFWEFSENGRWFVMTRTPLSPEPAEGHDATQMISVFDFDSGSVWELAIPGTVFMMWSSNGDGVAEVWVRPSHVGDATSAVVTVPAAAKPAQYTIMQLDLKSRELRMLREISATPNAAHK